MKLPEMTRRNKILLILALVVVLIPSFFFYDYTQSNPRFCTTCHLMNPAFDTWTVSAMHNLSCHKCHETDMVESLGHVVEVVTRNPNYVTKEVKIDNSLCESCHTSEDPKWLQIADTAGHKAHIYGNIKQDNCIHCHGERLHVFSPPEDICLGCHTAQKTQVEAIMGTHCVICHDFIATDHELFPQDRTCLQCHEEKDPSGVSFPVGAHNDTACINCHDPHKENPFPDCTSCHTEGGSLHLVPSHNDCTSCHVPHSENTLRENCLTCHTDKKEHFAPASCSTCHRFGKTG